MKRRSSAAKTARLSTSWEDYMRRRDPNSMVISDEFPTDKPRFQERFGYSFSKVRQETMDWLSEQRVIMLPFKAGDPAQGMTVCSFARRTRHSSRWRLPTCRGFVAIQDIPENYTPRAIIYVARPSGTRILTASRSLSTIAARACTRSSRTISIRAPQPKRAFIPCFSTSASTRAGSAATRLLR